MSRRLWVILAVTLGWVLFVLGIAQGSKPVRMYLLTVGHDSGWACDSILRACYAGGRDILQVRLAGVSEPLYPSLESGWPPAITIDAGEKIGDSFIPDSRLLELLSISRLIDRHDYLEDSVGRSKHEMSWLQKEYGVCYKFAMSIPTQYVGRRIYLRTTYDSPETGRMAADYTIDPITPCNERARQTMQSTYVMEATLRGKHESAMQIADSLIKLGWRDYEGLTQAAEAARLLGRAEDAKRYRELTGLPKGFVPKVEY